MSNPSRVLPAACAVLALLSMPAAAQSVAQQGIVLAPNSVIPGVTSPEAAVTPLGDLVVLTFAVDPRSIPDVDRTLGSLIASGDVVASTFARSLDPTGTGGDVAYYAAAIDASDASGRKAAMDRVSSSLAPFGRGFGFTGFDRGSTDPRTAVASALRGLDRNASGARIGQESAGFAPFPSFVRP